MRCDRITFQFGPRVNLDGVEDTTRLAFLGATGQHSAPLIRLYARYQMNRSRRTVTVIGADDIVMTIAGLMVSFFERELGADAFTTDHKPARTAARGPSHTA